MKFKILEGKVELFRRKDSKIILAGVCGIWEKDTQILKIYTGNSQIDWTQNTITIKTVEGIDVIEIIREGENLSGENILIDLPFNYIFTVEVNGQQEIRTLDFEADIETETVDTEYLESNGKTVSTCLAELVITRDLDGIFVDKESWNRYVRSQRIGNAAVSPYLDEYGRIVASEYDWEVYEEITSISFRGGYTSYFGEVPFVELTGVARKKVYHHGLGDTVTSTGSLVPVKEIPGIEIVINDGEENIEGITIDNKNLRIYFDWNVVNRNSVFYIYLRAGKLMSRESVTFGYVGGDIVNDSIVSAFSNISDVPLFVFQSGTKNSMYLKCKSSVPTNHISIFPDKFNIEEKVSGAITGDSESFGYLALEFSFKEDIDDLPTEPEKFELKVDSTTIYKFYAQKIEDNSSLTSISFGYGDSAIFVDRVNDTTTNGVFGLVSSLEDSEHLEFKVSKYIPTEYSDIFTTCTVEGDFSRCLPRSVSSGSEVKVVPSWEYIDIQDLDNEGEETYYIGTSFTSSFYTIIPPIWAYMYRIGLDPEKHYILSDRRITISNIDEDCTYTFINSDDEEYTATLNLLTVDEAYSVDANFDFTIPELSKNYPVGILYIGKSDWSEIYKILPIYLKSSYKFDNSISIDFPGTVDSWISSEIEEWKTENAVRTYADFNIIVSTDPPASYTVDAELGCDSTTGDIKYECAVTSQDDYIDFIEADRNEDSIFIRARVKPNSLPTSLANSIDIEVVARCGGAIIGRKSGSIVLKSEFTKIEFVPTTMDEYDYKYCNPKVTAEEVKCPYYVVYYKRGNTYENMVNETRSTANYYSTKIIVSSKELSPEDIECYAQDGIVGGNNWRRLKQSDGITNSEVVLTEITREENLAAVKRIRYEVSYIPSVVSDGFPVHPMMMKIGNEKLYMFFLPLNPYIRGYNLCQDNNDWVDTILKDNNVPGEYQTISMINPPSPDTQTYITSHATNPLFEELKDTEAVNSNLGLLDITYPSFITNDGTYLMINVSEETPQSELLTIMVNRQSLTEVSKFPTLAALGIPSQGVSYDYFIPAADISGNIVLVTYLVNYVEGESSSSDEAVIDPEEVVDFDTVFPINMKLNSFGEQNVAVIDDRESDPEPVAIVSGVPWADVLTPDHQWKPDEDLLEYSPFASTKMITVSGRLNNLTLTTNSTFPDRSFDSNAARCETTVNASVDSRYELPWISADITRYYLEPELVNEAESVLLIGNNYRYTGFNFYQPKPDVFVKTGDRVYRIFQDTSIVNEIGSEGGSVSFDINLYRIYSLWNYDSYDPNERPFIDLSCDANINDSNVEYSISGSISIDEPDIDEDGIMTVSIPAMTSNDVEDKEAIVHFTYTYNEYDEVPIEGEESSSDNVEKTITFDYIIKQRYNPLHITTTANPSIYSFGVGIIEFTTQVSNLSIESMDPDIEIEYPAGNSNKFAVLTDSNVDSGVPKHLSIPLQIAGQLNGEQHTWNQIVECEQGCFDIYIDYNNKLVFNRLDPFCPDRIMVPNNYDNVDIIPRLSEMQVNVYGSYSDDVNFIKEVVDSVDVSLVLDGSLRQYTYPYLETACTVTPKYESSRVEIKLPVQVTINLGDGDADAADLINLYSAEYNIKQYYSKILSDIIITNK